MSAISGVSSTPYVYVPKVTQELDLKGGLSVAKLPDSSDDDPSVGLVYSAKGLTTGASVPSTAVYLKDTNGDYFSIDAEKVSMVASGKELNLYVYQADGTADKYAFNATTGRLISDTPTSLSAIQFSAVEVAANRDLDGNGGIGAKLVKTGEGNGVLDSTGGLYRVSSLEQDLWVVGAGLDKSKSIDSSKSTLLNADGSAWRPEGDFVKFAAVSSTSKTAGTTWSVYATDASGEVTRFNFDKDRKLVEADTKVLTVNELAAAEKQALRDLNKDNTYGVNITGTIDAKTGLFKGSVLGQDFFLVGNALKSGTAKAPTDLSGSLLNREGQAWGLPEGFVVSAGVKNGTTGFSVYAYKTTTTTTEDQTVTVDDKNTVLRFDFVKDDKGNFVVSEDSTDGIEVDAKALAEAEKTAKRDLNADSVFGVRVTSTVDAVGGLYAATALGNDFLLVGKALTSSASKPLDLATALKTSDGSAWRPDDVTNLNSNVRIVGLSGDAGGYEVYVKEDSGTFAKYTFDSNYTLTGDREELSTEALAAAEVSTKRDLNGDTAFGFKVAVNGLIDPKSGLYKGSFENQSNIFLVSDSKKLTVGSKVASNGVDLANALKVGDDYWNVDDGYSVKAGYRDADSGKFVLIATANGNANDVRKYTFDTDNKLIDDESGDMSLFNLAATEKALGRDLNGDKVTGVKTGATLDKTGGLHSVTLGTGASAQTFLTLGTKASDVKDLSTALLDAEGNAWKLGTGETVAAMVTEKTEDGEVAGYSLYASKTVNGAQQITRYSFGTDYKYDDAKDDNAKVLSQAEIADAEKASLRDINGDKSVGAKVTEVLDKTGGLYQATMSNGSTNTLVTFLSSDPPGRAVSLSDKMLLAADEASAWQADGGFKIKAVLTQEGGGYSVYASKTGDPGEVKRYSFDANRVFTESESLTADQLVALEKTAGRDINNDKAVGLNVAEAIDRKGSLYKASVLGQDYLVVGKDPGAVLKTGKTADSAIDLTRALLDGNGNAWKAAEGWSIGGVVKNASNGYEVYTYQKTDNEVTAVKVHTWNDKFEYMDATDADLVALVEVEKTAKRDLSGDGVVGFRKVDTLTEGFAGVTEAKVAGGMTFLLAGSNLKNGTPTNPLSIKDALLNEDGSGPWAVDTGFRIKAVDDGDSATKRYVYAVNASNEVRRYEFDKTSGKVSGAGVTVSAVELAAKEVSRKRDLSGDGKTGVATVSNLMDGSRQTGLLNANVLGQDFLVIRKLPLPGQNINLTAALLKQDGTAWASPSEFSIKGVYETKDGEGNPIAEVYGVKDDKTIQRYTFSKQEDGTFKLNSADPELVTGVGMALREAQALKDLNGDASIGFKVSGSALATQSNGWSVGTAKVDTPDSDDSDEINDSPTVYIVGKNLGKMGSVASNLANSAALFSGDDYWKPGEGETVISLVQKSDTEVNVYTSVTDENSVVSYVRHAFAQADGKWDLSASENLTSEAMIAEEASAGRDINGDTAVGLKVAGDFIVSGMSKAEIDGKSYYFAGNVYSGTGVRPLDLTNTKLLTDADGKAWSTAETITSWEVLGSALPDGAPEGAKYVVKWDGGSQYFGSDMKTLAAEAATESPEES